MPKFSKQSLARLVTCHPDLQQVCLAGIEKVDFVILYGTRGREEQELLFKQGKSKLNWPDSAHNKTPSLAVDVAPFPIDWDDVRRFIRLASYLQGLGAGMGIPLRIGGDWNSDFIMNENFYDWPHIELKEKT